MVKEWTKLSYVESGEIDWIKILNENSVMKKVVWNSYELYRKIWSIE